MKTLWYTHFEKWPSLSNVFKMMDQIGISNIRWILFKNVLKRCIHNWSAWKIVTVGKFNTWTKYKLYNTDEYRLIMYIKNIEERRIQPIVSADKS